MKGSGNAVYGTRFRLFSSCVCSLFDSLFGLLGIEDGIIVRRRVGVTDICVDRVVKKIEIIETETLSN